MTSESLDHSTLNERIAALGLTIPALDIPDAAHRPYVVHNGTLHVSGQLPLRHGKPVHTGRVPSTVTLEAAREAAHACVENILGWVWHAVQGRPERVSRCLRLGGFVAVDASFTDAPSIINTASRLMTDLFGAQGEHARIAIGVATLPQGVPVEIEATFALRESE